MKNCNKQVVHRPIHSCEPLLVETIISRLWHGFSLVLGKATDCKKTSFRILVGIYYHNIPTHTPQSGYHGVTEVAKTANIAKMAEKCINCMSTRPTPPHTKPMESGPGNSFSAQNRKEKKSQKIHDFQPKTWGGLIFRHF